jgi:hypothetical protein
MAEMQVADIIRWFNRLRARSEAAPAIVAKSPDGSG